MKKAIIVQSLDPQWRKWAALKPGTATRWYDTLEEAARDARLFNDRYGIIRRRSHQAKN